MFIENTAPIIAKEIKEESDCEKDNASLIATEEDDCDTFYSAFAWYKIR